MRAILLGGKRVIDTELTEAATTNRKRPTIVTVWFADDMPVNVEAVEPVNEHWGEYTFEHREQTFAARIDDLRRVDGTRMLAIYQTERKERVMAAVPYPPVAAIRLKHLVAADGDVRGARVQVGQRVRIARDSLDDMRVPKYLHRELVWVIRLHRDGWIIVGPKPFHSRLSAVRPANVVEVLDEITEVRDGWA